MLPPYIRLMERGTAKADDLLVKDGKSISLIKTNSLPTSQGVAIGRVQQTTTYEAAPPVLRHSSKTVKQFYIF